MYIPLISCSSIDSVPSIHRLDPTRMPDKNSWCGVMESMYSQKGTKCMYTGTFSLSPYT